MFLIKLKTMGNCIIPDLNNFIIYCGNNAVIDLEEYFGVTKSPERESGIKNILFVGRLNPVKGLQYLIMAMKLVHDKMPEARLILVGDGKERELLAALSKQLNIQKYVLFIGKVPHEKVKKFAILKFMLYQMELI